MASKQKKSSLIQSFTTVTPLSKAIALTLFVLLPILAFCFGVQYQKEIDLGSQQIITEIKGLPNTPTAIPHQLPQQVKNY